MDFGFGDSYFKPFRLDTKISISLLPLPLKGVCWKFYKRNRGNQMHTLFYAEPAQVRPGKMNLISGSLYPCL